MPARFSTRMCEQHRQVLALFSSAVRAGQVVDFERYEAFRRALVQHIAVEEKVLMPALAQKLGAAFEPLRRELRQHHAAIVSLLVPTPNEIWLEDLRETLVHHFEVEESPGQLQSLTDARLAPDEDELLWAIALQLPPIALEPFEDGPEMPRVLQRISAAIGLGSP